MPLNPDIVGTTYPAGEPYQVGREKVREFARAVGEPSPAARDLRAAQALGYTDLVAPPTFAFVLVMAALDEVMFDPRIGMDYSRVVHGEQSFEFARPLVAGDEVVIESVVEALDSTGRNEFLTVRADIRTTGGEQVVSTRSVLVSRGTGLAATAHAAAEVRP